MKLFFLSLVVFLSSFQLFSQQEVRWACRIEGTNESYQGNQFSVRKALGVPDAYPGYGSTENYQAWIPGYSISDMHKERDTYLKVGFCDPIIPKQIVIVESVNPGTITSVTIFEENGKAQEIYKAKAGDIGEKSRVLSIPVKESKSPVVAVLITTSAGNVSSLSQIDAIGMASTDDPVNLKINISKDADLIGTSTALSDSINTVAEETYPITSSDGKILYFARSGDKNNIGNPNTTDIWYALKKNDGTWSKAKNIGKPLNNDAHNFVTSITSDVNTLLLANTYNPDGSFSNNGVSISNLRSGGWEVPKTLQIEGFENLSAYTSYFLASDGKTLLLGIQTRDSYGELDIFVSFLKSNGTWTKPMNLGKQINTFQEEANPFLAADGKTLYFASTGHLGYGGYDVFMSKRLDETWQNWSEPLNLGPHVNTSGSQLSFSVPASGNVAYTYGERDNHYHSDIFSVSLSPLVKPEPVTIVSGRVLDANTKKPLGAKIEYELLPSGTNAGYANSNPTDGNYKIVLNNGNTYGYSAEVPGYFSVHENITIDSKALFTEIHVDLLMVPIEKGQQMTLQNVFFHQSTPQLIESSYPELDRLIVVLKTNPLVRIELDGHTDNQGDPALNLSLSEKRAIAVKDYLVSKGVHSSRITTRAYGGTKPVAPNDTEENRKKNRRVEITVI